MALINNSESSLNTGFNDDYCFYRGVDDPVFCLADTDTILGKGDTGSSGATFFGAARIPALNRLLRHPEIEPQYRRTLTATVLRPMPSSMVAWPLRPENVGAR